MTTITVEINKDNDLSVLKEFIGQLELKYHVEQNETLVYTDEVKDLLDSRYLDYTDGKVQMVTQEESQMEIQRILSGAK